MSKTYRTAMGKTIDMGSMVLANENVRAIGNQKVNAKGDIIDSNNNVVKSRQQQLAEQYGTQAKKPNRPSNTQKPRAEKPVVAPKVKESQPELIAQDPVDFPDDVAQDDVEVIKEEPAPAKPVSGLAAAIAKTKETKKQ
jgi:hypothetical protein